MARRKKTVPEFAGPGTPLANGTPMPNIAKPERVLARPGDPYMTSAGRIIHESDVGKPNSDGAVPVVTAKDFKATKHRMVKDMPAPVGFMNGVACVFLYTIFGISDREICDSLKIDRQQLAEIRTHSAYAESFDVALSEFINANSDLMTARLAGYSHNALSSVAYLAFNSEDEKLRFRASDKLLDRAGIGVQPNGAKGGAGGKNDFRIVYVNGDAKVDVSIKTE